MASFPDTAAQEAQTLRELTTSFGFPRDRALEAINAIGNKADVAAACDWLLDHGEEDKGGSVVLKHCTHLDYVDQVCLVAPDQLTYGRPCAEGCPCGENWICLVCGETRCSRYVNSHNLAHCEQTKAAEAATLTVADAARGKEALGHCLALSLSDLSVWCYECSGYVTHPRLKPLNEQMQVLKFGGGATPAAPATPTTVAAESDAASDAHPGTETEQHGALGVGRGLPAPTAAVVCEQAARPGYRTCSATEYLDAPEALEAKIKILADLVRRAQCPVAYTGAGISTSSGISDYATRAGSASLARGPAALDTRGDLVQYAAQPTQAHHALVAMHRAGFLEKWVQQNHDGLPQKAGFPQEKINEIHGAFYDPANPVVPMDGSLRPDLLKDLLDWEERADLCLVLGTSLAGMNSDRLVTSTAQRSRRNQPGALGAVIVSLQRTRVDEVASLRLFAPIDQVMTMLAAELELTVPDAAQAAAAAAVEPGANLPDVFTNLPYNPATGLHDPTACTTLDLRPGSTLQLIGQVDWDVERNGSTGEVTGIDAWGHFKVNVGHDQRRLGRWWLESAARGALPQLPVLTKNSALAAAAAVMQAAFGSPPPAAPSLGAITEGSEDQSTGGV